MMLTRTGSMTIMVYGHCIVIGLVSIIEIGLGDGTMVTIGIIYPPRIAVVTGSRTVIIPLCPGDNTEVDKDSL